MATKYLNNKCKHDWQIASDHATGARPTMVICNRCSLLLSASAAIQHETYKFMSGWRFYVSILAIIISFIAVTISYLTWKYPTTPPLS